MKKWFVFAVAALMLVAFSGPVAADVKVGGKIAFDTYYQKFNAEYRGRSAATPNISSLSEFCMENNSSTNINVRWTSDDNKFGAYLEIAVGGSNDFPSGIQYQNAAGLIAPANLLTNLNAADSVYARYSYGWWQVTPTFKLTLGQDTTGFAPMNALGQMQGTAAGQFKVVGLGFGNTHSGRVYQIRGDFALGKLGSLQLALVDPHGSSLLVGTHWGKNATINPVTLNQVCPAGNEASTMPRVDLSAVLNLGPVTLYPALLYKKMEWDPIVGVTPAGSEMDIKTMLYSLGAKANFGPVSLTGEITAGDNAGNANLLVNGIWFGYGPGGPLLDTAAIIDGAGKVSDTEYLAYFIDLGFKFGHMTLHGVYGRCKIENDMGTTAALVNNPDRENTRSMWAVNLWVPLSKNMIIIPEMVFYDYGDREIQNAAAVDLGKASIFGIQWLIMF